MKGTIARGDRTLVRGLMLTLSMAVLAVGCGAKTGLELPDADAATDAGPDAGPDAALDAGVPCVEVPFDGGVIEVPLDIEAELARADVLFLIDTTASMSEEIDQVRNGLRDEIAPGIADAIPDSALGVASFGDFPEGMCGEAGDLPFSLVLPVTTELNLVQAAVDSLDLGNGLDRPESQVEALYQVATGEGIGSYVPPSFGCPSGGVGYPCFRPDALPVVLLFTDAPFHSGPGGTNPYRCGVTPPPHTYPEAVDALSALSIRVMGLYSGSGEGRGDLLAIARDTGAVEGTSPLVFDIGMRGERLSSSVVAAIRTLADVIEFDVDTVLEDPDLTDDVDPRDFVEAVVPVRADPMDRIRGIDEENGTFLGVRAGTRVFFELRIVAGAAVPGPDPQRFLLEIVFRGDRRTRLGSRIVEIVIPGEDGEGCEDNR
jgi:predicted small lipoprotein YifL